MNVADVLVEVQLGFESQPKNDQQILAGNSPCTTLSPDIPKVDHHSHENNTPKKPIVQGQGNQLL